MNIFDKFVRETTEIIGSEQPEQITELKCSCQPWEIQDKNTFLMERDTAIELGGYPKESINLIIPSSNLRELSGLGIGLGFGEGVYCIGDPGLLANGEKHISFGKIVLLETEAIGDDDIYEFTQQELLTDSRIRMKDVMLRQSPAHYNLNLRIAKAAILAGFDLDKMGRTVQESFAAMEHVKSVTVIFIVGDSALYKKLLGVAEMVKEVTLTLNHIFDGIDMDCGSCDLSEICDEVEGVRELHKRLKY